MDIDNNTSLNILLVEGDTERSNLVRRLLADSNIVGRLHTVGCNVEALAYVRRDAPYLSAPSPDFILMGHDADGNCCCDFNKEIASNARLANTQLIALEDALAEDRVPFYSDCCDLKPVNPFALADTISRLRIGRSKPATNLKES